MTRTMRSQTKFLRVEWNIERFSSDNLDESSQLDQADRCIL